MEEEEAEADLEAIQAHLEMSMALTYQAVEASLKNSTLPDEQTYESLATFKPRPPRMGVGDMRERNGESSSLARETVRLYGRLAGKKRSREEEETKATKDPLMNGVKKPKVSTVAPIQEEPDDDDDEGEESRSKSISTKTANAQAKKPMDRFALPNNKRKSKGKNSDGVPSVNGKPLLFDATFSTEKGEETSLPVPTPSSSSSLEPTKAKPEGNSSRERQPVQQTNPPPDEKSRTTGPSSPKERAPSPLDRRSQAQRDRRSGSILSSHSTSSSRYSRDLSRRRFMKQEALAGFRLVRVEKVKAIVDPEGGESEKAPPPPSSSNSSSPTCHKSSPPARAANPNADHKGLAPFSGLGSKRKEVEDEPSVPVLRLEPLTVAQGAIGATDDSKEGEKKKKKRRKKKKKSRPEDERSGEATRGMGVEGPGNEEDEDEDD